jgi:ABC-type branched-subunit amino acid transport system substrate-binding protein
VSAFTAPPLAQLPGAERAQVTLFNGGGNDPSLLGHDWLYNAVLMSDQEARAVMQWAYDNLNARSIGIVFETDYTASALAAFRQAWKDVCATCPSTEVSVDNTATDTTIQIQKLRAAKPDVIFSTTNGTILQLQLKQMGQLGVTQPILSTSAIFALPEEFKGPVGKQLVGVRQIYKPEQAFLDGFQKLQPGQEPNLYTHNYYVIGQIIKQALERAIDQGYGVDGAAMKKALDELNLFTPTHGSTSQAEIVRAPNGQQEVVATVDALPSTAH